MRFNMSWTSNRTICLPQSKISAVQQSPRLALQDSLIAPDRSPALPTPDRKSAESVRALPLRRNNVRTITVVSGNLFQIAAAELGDAMQWINIARANSLTDPFISSLSQISIPSSQPAFADGIAPQ
jgi:hypothetical protein